MDRSGFQAVPVMPQSQGRARRASLQESRKEWSCWSVCSHETPQKPPNSKAWVGRSDVCSSDLAIPTDLESICDALTVPLCNNTRKLRECWPYIFIPTSPRRNRTEMDKAKERAKLERLITSTFIYLFIL